MLCPWFIERLILPLCWNPDSGFRIPVFRKLLLMESKIRGILACVIRNPGLCHPDCSSRNPESL